MIYLVAATLLYSAALLIGTSAARNANTNIVSLITNLTTLVPALAVVLPNLTKYSWSKQRYGFLMAALGGLVVGTYVLTLNKAFTLNKIGIIMPLVFGGTIFITTVLSTFLFKEKISLYEGIGLVLVLIGIGVIVYAREAAA